MSAAAAPCSVLGKRKTSYLPLLPRDIWRLIASMVEIADCGGITLDEYVKQEIQEEELLNISYLGPRDLQEAQKIYVRRKVDRKVSHIRERVAFVTSGLQSL